MYDFDVYPEDLELDEDFELPDDPDEEGELLMSHYWDSLDNADCLWLYRYKGFYVGYSSAICPIVSTSLEEALSHIGLLYINSCSRSVVSTLHSSEELRELLVFFEGGMDPVEQADGSAHEPDIRMTLNGEPWICREGEWFPGS
jgi:hypothetical protein